MINRDYRKCLWISLIFKSIDSTNRCTVYYLKWVQTYLIIFVRGSRKEIFRMIFDISLSSQHNIIQSWCLSCFAVQLVHYIHLSDVCIFCAFTVVILFLFSHRVMLSMCCLWTWLPVPLQKVKFSIYMLSL